MAKQLIPEELDQLIQEYLTDGVLTDKERSVILKKAEGMGLDRDEIDLYLDAQVQKIDQATDAAARRQKGKTCPYCGGSVPQLTDKCPHCGENITAQASEELQEIFDNLEEALVDLKSGKELDRSKATVERYARKAKMYYGSNPKVQKLLLEIENETIESAKRVKADARKNAILQYVLNHIKFFIWLFVILIALLSIKMCVNCADENRRESKQKVNELRESYVLDKPKIDEQLDQLTKKIDNLEKPNKNNYEFMTRELQKIEWNNISRDGDKEDVWDNGHPVSNEYEEEQKAKFVELKRAYAYKLQKIYKAVYSESDYYKYTPEIIREPGLNIHN